MDFPLSQPNLDLYQGRFTNGVPGLRPASVIPSVTLNAIIDEISALIVVAGLVPDEASVTQLRDAILTIIGNEAVDLAAPTGASTVGHLPLGANAVATTVDDALKFNQVSAFHFMDAAQIADVRAGTYLLDMTVPLAAATSYLNVLGGGDLIAPRGGYLLNGFAGADAYKNGILLSDTDGDFTTRKGINIIGEGVETVFRAGSADMIVVRNSRIYSGGESYKIDGAGLANVIGLAVAPESLTQTTELVSQSYAMYNKITIENCTEGLLVQPGPTVTGSDSGCFYHNFHRMNFNLNVRAIWMKKDVTGLGNRTTRTSFYNPVVTRGNTGFQIDGGTEIDIYSPYFEMINTGVTPSAIPTAFNYADTNPANIRIFGGYAEACTKALVALHPEHVQTFGFYHNSAKDSSEYFMGRCETGGVTIPKLANTQAHLTFGTSSIVSLVADPDQNGQKALALKINSAEKERWGADGSKTFYGSLGNVGFGSNGSSINFTRAGENLLTAPVGGSFSMRAPMHQWSSQTGVLWATMSGTEFVPRIDNATSFGISGLRWSAIWAANGVIQTSDPSKKKEIIESPLGLDFVLALKPKAYKFISGGNKVVGTREVAAAVLDEEGNELEPAKVEPILESVPGRRQHFGFLTTDVKAAAGGVDFGGYIKSDINDPESEEGLRYEEFIAPLIKAVQELSAEFNAYKASHP